LTPSISINKSSLLFFILITTFVGSFILCGMMSLKAARVGLTLLSVVVESDDIEFTFKKKKEVLEDEKRENDLSFKKRHQGGEIAKSDAKLSFFIPFESIAKFQVTGAERRLNYTMIPIETKFKYGFYTFFWQRNLLNLLRLEITDLFAYGYSIDEYKMNIFPVILHDTELPEKIKVKGYSFVFEAYQESTVSFRIRGTDLKEILFEENIQAHSRQPFLIQWIPDKSLDTGKYYFVISARSKGYSHRFLNEFTFYHKNEISTKDTKAFSGYRLEGIKDVKI